MNDLRGTLRMLIMHLAFWPFVVGALSYQFLTQPLFEGPNPVVGAFYRTPAKPEFWRVALVWAFPAQAVRAFVYAAVLFPFRETLVRWRKRKHDEDLQIMVAQLRLGGRCGDSDHRRDGRRSRSSRSERRPRSRALATVRTLIHDTDHGQDAELSLGLAIDMLWPCHWNFVGNLQIVLEAIGGRLSPEKPFAACGRNITLVPNQERLGAICNTLRVCCGELGAEKADREVVVLLGAPTPEKRWLAASLEKTIRLRWNPPAGMRAASALAGPAWIRQ